MTELIVTNLHKRFTGVSSTTAAVVRQHLGQYDLALCGTALPGCPDPVGRWQALALSRRPGRGGVMVWHTRRDNEMQLALFARDVLRLPIRIVYTSPDQRRRSGWPRALMARMDAVIATSQLAADFLPNTTAVVPHGVDTELFRPAPDRAAAWAATGFPGARGIACIGRIRPEKGTDLFVRAMLALLPARPDLTAVAFGLTQSRDQEFLAGLQRDIAAAGLGGRILFPGELPPAELARLLPGFSLLMAPPRYEGFGMTVLEAMAAGVPFVASDAGAFRDASDHGRAGTVVALEDVPALVAAAGALLDAPERLEQAARAARELALGRWSIRHEAARIAEVYEQLWARP